MNNDKDINKRHAAICDLTISLVLTTANIFEYSNLNVLCSAYAVTIWAKDVILSCYKVLFYYLFQHVLYVVIFIYIHRCVVFLLELLLSRSSLNTMWRMKGEELLLMSSHCCNIMSFFCNKHVKPPRLNHLFKSHSLSAMCLRLLQYHDTLWCV